MEWGLSGKISMVKLEVSWTGNRQLGGWGHSWLSDYGLGVESSAVEAITERVYGSRIVNGDPPTITDIYTEWRLASNLHPRLAWGSALRNAVKELPGSAVVACALPPPPPGHNLSKCLSISFVLPDDHASIVYQHVYDLMGAPDVRFTFTFQESEILAAYVSEESAKDADEFLAGKPILLAPADVALSFTHDDPEPEPPSEDGPRWPTGEEWRG